MIHLSAFETCDTLPDDLNQILIARIDTSKPNVDFYGKVYEPLFPRFSFFLKLDDILDNLGVEEEPTNVYTELYKKNVLSKLDPVKVYDDLKALAGDDDDFALLNESSKDCVRSILSDWFNDAGVPCIIDMPDSGKASVNDISSAGHVVYDHEKLQIA